MNESVEGIPEGYSQLAKSEGLQFGNASAVMYRNKKLNLFYISVGKLNLGPLMQSELEAVSHVAKDSLDLVA